MTSNRPYLVRAIYEWIVDNDLTPHLLVDALAPEVQVPHQFVEDGKIVLNVAPASVRGLELGNDYILFGARFSGSHFDVIVPGAAVLAIYARENGKGIAFPETDPVPARVTEKTPEPIDSVETASDDADECSDTPPEPPRTDPPSGRPSLRIVK